MSTEQLPQRDIIAKKLESYAQNILVIIFGLLPLIFIPTVAAPFEYTKILVVIAGLFAALILYTLSVLRSGTVGVGISYPLCALIAAAVVALLSSLLSGDLRDSLTGDFFSIHSSIFVVLLAFVPMVWMLLRPTKESAMKMYLLFAASTLVLVLFHTLRLVFGPEFLSFGIFTSTVSTPVGTWNDLALFLGLVVVLSLVVLEHIPLTRVGRIFFGVVTALSLGMLAVINFFTVWLILGLSSLVLTVHILRRDRFTGAQPSLMPAGSGSASSLLVSLMVFVVSIVFVVGGGLIGGFISNLTGVSYVEVRPSFEATLNIATSVYQDNALLGIGANKFADAWRLYKDIAINTTPFWNTDFNAGNGYITTFFVTTGVLGGLAWIAFLVLYVTTGVRRLLTTSGGDKVWYFIGLSSFVSALYIWGMSVFYVPGAVILLIGALCTGVSLHAFGVLREVQPRTIAVGSNRRTGFVLTLVVILVIVGSVSTLYATARHYMSVYVFNDSVRAMQAGETVGELEQRVMSAYTLSTSDVFARRIAEYQLARLNSLAQLAEPTEAQQAEFNDAMVNGVRFAQEAVRIDAFEPANWAVLAGIYDVLARLEVEGAGERVEEALAKSRELNPKNPLPYLESAVVAARGGDNELARSYIEEAIRLKSNSSEAFYLLSQLAILEGNVEEAVQSTLAIITLEPNNPIRYYQLGVLESSRDNIEAAIAAFEQAVALDPNYANAHYLLALSYDSQGESEMAREHLQRVLELNPGNAEITELISVLDTEGSLDRLRTDVSPTVDESAPTTGEEGSVSTGQDDPETPLLTPVNTPPQETGDNQSE